jgi:hypothetical protein
LYFGCRGPAARLALSHRPVALGWRPGRGQRRSCRLLAKLLVRYLYCTNDDPSAAGRWLPVVRSRRFRCRRRPRIRAKRRDASTHRSHPNSPAPDRNPHR